MFTANNSNLNSIQNFYANVQKFEDKILHEKLKLSDAMEELFQGIDNGLFSIDKKVMDVVNDNLTGFLLATNYFHPKYHGHHFCKHQPFYQLLQKFILQTAPIDAFDHISYYNGRNGPFLNLFEVDEPNNDYLRFWNVGKMFCKPFSDYAIDLLSISTLCPKINIIEIAIRYSQYSNSSERLRSFIFSILYKEF